MSLFKSLRGRFILPRLFGILILIALGGNLYYVSLKARLAEENLARLEQDIKREQDRIRVLQAELVYLSSPARLSSINDEFFGWQAAKPTQVTRFSDLPDRDNSEKPYLPFPPIADTQYLARPVSLPSQESKSKDWAQRVPNWLRFSRSPDSNHTTNNSMGGRN